MSELSIAWGETDTDADKKDKTDKRDRALGWFDEV
jgi:hypothetical protein